MRERAKISSYVIGSAATHHFVCSSLDRRSGFRHWARNAEGRESRRLYTQAGCDVEGAGFSAKYAAAQLTGNRKLQLFFLFFSRREGGKAVPFSVILSASASLFFPLRFTFKGEA